MRLAEGDVVAELQDRYGTPPEAVLNLLAAGEIRLRCEQLGISQLDRKRTQIELPNPSGNRKAPIKAFIEMLHVKFVAVNADPDELAQAAIDPAMLMKLVSRNAKRGAQFTPDGMLKFILKATAAEEVLRTLRTILEQLASAEIPSEVRSTSNQT